MAMYGMVYWMMAEAYGCGYYFTYRRPKSR